jgi:hypothetical protein
LPVVLTVHRYFYKFSLRPRPTGTSANLITNPGFETGDFTGWTAVGEIQPQVVVGEKFGISPHSGNAQALFQGAAASLGQSVATTSGASYTISFFLALASGERNSFSVMWGGVTLLSLTNQSPFGYTEYTFNMTGSPGSTALLFQFNHFRTEDGHWLFDDVSVNPAGVGVPDAGSTVSLLGSALLGLAAFRRKLSC